MKQLIDLCKKLMVDQSFDCLAVSTINFAELSFDCFELTEKKSVSPSPYLFFDLASLTKPLTLSSTYLKNEDLFDKDMKLLLNHRAGLPAWRCLDGKAWREEILRYTITESETLYSDLSALRLMLEIEKRSGSDLSSLCSYFWEKDLLYWKDLTSVAKTPRTGYRGGKPIIGDVNDDNAFKIDQFCSHAGLFSTISSLSQSLINLERETQFLTKMDAAFKSRCDGNQYLLGWDTANLNGSSLAGEGHSKKTFGHLGFTGTSIWIDIEKKMGNIILSNATREFWYDRLGLNSLRKKIGEYLWSSKKKE